MDAQWVQDYFKTVDTLDADAIASHFTDDGKFRFSNQPPAVGKQGDRVKMMVQQIANNVRGGAVDRCGHFIPDERPDYLIEQLFAFFADISKSSRETTTRKSLHA